MMGRVVVRLLYSERTRVLTTSADASTVEEEGCVIWVITCGNPMTLAVVVSYEVITLLAKATVVRYHYKSILAVDLYY